MGGTTGTTDVSSVAARAAFVKAEMLHGGIRRNGLTRSSDNGQDVRCPSWSPSAISPCFPQQTLKPLLFLSGIFFYYISMETVKFKIVMIEFVIAISGFHCFNHVMP